MDEVVASNDALESTLGIAPSGLEFCFDRRSFLNASFDEDAFILDRLKMGISLQALHDSLLQYFNILKNSLVELINRDYVDFVNLSTNLVGLNKIIESLEEPLVGVRERVSNALAEIREAKQEFEFNIEKRRKLREKKELINSLITVANCTNRLERWLSPTAAATPPSDENLNPLSGEENTISFHEEQQIERVAQEYTKLQHFVKKCSNHPLVEELKPRIHLITVSLQDQLEGRLRLGLDLCHEAHASGELHSSAAKKASSMLRQVLSTYLSIDKLASAVSLYRGRCLHAQLSKVFSPCPELSISSSDTATAAATFRRMVGEAVDLLDKELSLFQTLVFKRLHKSYEPLSEFDVIVDGFFPEAVEVLFAQLSFIFSAGNPDKFHELYKIGLSFLDLVETRADSTKQVMKLREHPSYTAFLSKWSLSVYFQLRYQECNEAITECSRDIFKEADANPEGYSLVVTSTVIGQMRCCWSEQVYLPPLRHRFWKLTLQLINIYAHLIVEKAAQFVSNPPQKIGVVGVKPLLMALVDVSLFLNWIESGGLVDLVRPTMVQLQDNYSLPEWLTHCVESCAERIRTALTALKGAITKAFEEPMTGLTKQVQDLPRQYRRTNREFPTTASGFMTKINKLLVDLAYTLEAEVLSKPQVESSQTLRAQIVEVFEQLVLQSTNMYVAQREELMESVRKVETSLRRLRVARAVGGAQQQAGNGSAATKTDDEKIRHQVQLDTQAFVEQLKTLPLLSGKALELNVKTLESGDSADANNPTVA